MPARLLEDDAHRVQARLAGRERHARLVPVFRRQSLELTRPHVRRIRHDDIVGGAPERAEVIGLLEQYTAPETVGADVGARHLERRLRDIDRIDAGVRQRPRAGDGDAARARAEIEHPSHASRVDPRREAPLDQLRDRRAGHEHPRVDPDLEAREPGDAGQVGGRDAILDAPPDELRRARLRAGVDASPKEVRAAAIARPDCVQYQRGGFVPGIVGAVSEVHARARERPRGARDELAHGDGARGGGRVWGAPRPRRPRAPGPVK